MILYIQIARVRYSYLNELFMQCILNIISLVTFFKFYSKHIIVYIYLRVLLIYSMDFIILISSMCFVLKKSKLYLYVCIALSDIQYFIKQCWNLSRPDCSFGRWNLIGNFLFSSLYISISMKKFHLSDIVGGNITILTRLTWKYINIYWIFKIWNKMISSVIFSHSFPD